MLQRRNYMALAIFVLALLLLSGCYKQNDEGRTNNTSSGQAAQTNSPQSNGTVSPSSGGSAPVSNTQAIAEADGETGGTKVEVLELKRGSTSLMLKFAIVNNSDNPLNFGY